MGAASLAIESVLAPVVSVVVGLWLDRRFGWSPWGLYIGAAVGIVAAAVLMVELVRQLRKDDTKDLG